MSASITPPERWFDGASRWLVDDSELFQVINRNGFTRAGADGDTDEVVATQNVTITLFNPLSGSVFVKVLPPRYWANSFANPEAKIAEEISILYRAILEDERPSVIEVSSAPIQEALQTLMDSLEQAAASAVSVRVFGKGDIDLIPVLVNTLDRLRTLINQQTDSRTLLLTSVYDDWVRQGSLALSTAFCRLKLLTMAYEVDPPASAAVVQQQGQGSWWPSMTLDEWAVVENRLRDIVVSRRAFPER